MKRAVFFDLDGTLWDALEPLTKCWNKAMEDNNLPYRFSLSLMQSFMGLTPEETCPLAFPGTTLEEGLKLFKIVLDAEIKYLSKNPGTLYPNERKVLTKIREKYPTYIISNADKGYVENYLKACNMSEYFDSYIQQGDTGYPKWKNIIYMKEKYKFDEIIYVGDTLKDKIETEHAGEKFIHAAYGFGKIENDLYKIDSLNQLPDLIDIVFNKKA